MVAMNEDASVAVDALHEWATGFRLRKSAGAELIYAIHELVASKSFVAAKMSQPLERNFTHHPAVHGDKVLTRRQREVLQLLAEGLKMKETAATLKLTPRTIAFHKYKIMQDFELHTNLGLFKLAILGKPRLARMSLQLPPRLVGWSRYASDPSTQNSCIAHCPFFSYLQPVLSIGLLAPEH